MNIPNYLILLHLIKKIIVSDIPNLKTVFLVDMGFSKPVFNPQYKTNGLLKTGF